MHLLLKKQQFYEVKFTLNDHYKLRVELANSIQLKLLSYFFSKNCQ